MYYAVQISKTFSGLDDSLGDNPDRMLPCSTALCMAALCIPNGERLQSWMRYKLSHLERSGYKPEKKYNEILAAKWNMSDISVDGFYHNSWPSQEAAGFG